MSARRLLAAKPVQHYRNLEHRTAHYGFRLFCMLGIISQNFEDFGQILNEFRTDPSPARPNNEISGIGIPTIPG